jgi:RHS repeat-associated protein
VCRPRMSGLLFILWVLSIFCALPAAAQDIDPNFEIGLKPFGSYHGGNIDLVSQGDGALSVDIPLISYPQRGRKLKLAFSLHYFNWGMGADQQCYPPPYGCYWIPAGTTPAGFYVMDEGGMWAETSPAGSMPFVLEAIEPDGASHLFGETATNLFESVDATGYSGLFSTSSHAIASVTDPEGTTFTCVVTFPEQQCSSREDTNGNQITLNLNGTGYTDTMGRTIPLVGAITSTNSADFSGCSGTQPITVVVLWNPPGPYGGTYPLKFCYFGQTVPTGFTLQSVVLPDNTTWTFQWGSVITISGQVPVLTQITFPTGGTLSYGWTGIATCMTHQYVYEAAVSSRTLAPNDGVTPSATWRYTYSGGEEATSIAPSAGNSVQTRVVTDPLGNDTVHTFGYGGCYLYETTTQFYQGSYTGGTLLKTLNTTNTYLWGSVGFPNTSILNLVPVTMKTTWANGQTNQVTKTYDAGFTFQQFGLTGTVHTGTYGKELTKSEYDYGNGAPGALLRTTTKTYLGLSNSTYKTYNIIEPISSLQMKDGGGTQRGYTTYSYDGSSPVSSGITTQHVTPPNGTYRGNVTATARWLNTTGTYLTSTQTYFDTGMVDVAKDPNLNPTTYGYSSTYVGAFPSTVTNALNQVTTNAYDFNTGLLTSTTDPNSKTTSYQYDDMLRTTQIISPDTGGATFTYPNPNEVEIAEKITASANRVSYLLVDGVGRQIRQAVTNGESVPYDEADTCYDGPGRASFKSYPFQDSGPFTTSRSCGSPELGDSYAYDPLNRTTSVTHSDGSSVLSSHMGRATSVQDEGNGTQRVQRVSQVDGLGRLASVCEVSGNLTVGISGSQSAAACGQDIGSTGFLTTYGYDALDNLTSVAQGPLSARSFVYDSLSRLTSSTNPEAGTTTYTYDADGNNLTKKDARNITSTYAYDTLNRLTSKAYSDGTPTVFLAYDQSSVWGVNLGSSIGRLTSSNAWNGAWVSGEIFAYDPMGRVINNSQCTPQNCSTTPFSVAYTYDLLGDITSSTPGEGMTLTNTYNAGARLTSVTSSISDSNHPGTLFGYQNPAHYNAAGSLLSVTLGNGINETRTYDARLRLTGITDGTVYSVTIPTSGGYAPNSDILAANDNVNGNWTYGYDTLNRLVSSNRNSGTTTYSYSDDRFGNRWNQTVTHGTGTPSSLGFDANNHITGSGVSYDLAGDTTYDGTTTYTYDAEGRVKTANNSISGSSSYAYDAEGRRIEKTTSAGGTVDFVYDLAGHEITQNSAGSWMRSEFYAGGRHVANYYGGTTYFIHADWLGTERARSNVSGALCESITSLAYGDAMTTSGSCGDPSPMHFTGKERDSESNLDNFGARYDSSSMGRFMSPDPVGGKRVDPQTLNKYSYVRNNPLTLTDPTGLYTCMDDSNQCKTKNDQNLHNALIALRLSGAQGALEAYNYGKAGDDNGVHVDFKSQQGMGGPGILGSTLPTGTPLSNGQIGNVHIEVNLLSGLKGKDLEQTVAHEGSHVQDAMHFLLSYDFSSRKFNSALNYFHYDTEFKAFESGAEIKPYRNIDCGGGQACDIVSGPHGYGNLDRYLNGTPLYREHNQDLEFDPQIWPQ